MAAKLTPGQLSYWKAKGVTGTKNITAARNKQIAENDPNAFGPGANLSPKQLGSQVQADATVQYGQQYAQIGQQYGQVDPIYDAYRKSITDLQAQAKSASDQATADISSRAAALAAADHADNAQMFADLAKDAASRGATTDPSLQATAQQASASRQATAGSDANLQTTLGANQQNFLGGQAALGEGARVNRKQTLANDMNTLVGQVGAFKVQDRAKIIAAAQAAGINLSQLGVAQQNADTAAGLAGVTAGKAKSDAAAKRALARNNKAKLNLSAGKISHDQMLADKKFQLDQQKFGAAKAKDNYQRTHKTGPYRPASTGTKTVTGGKTPAGQKITAGSKQTVTQVNNALGVIRTLTKAEGKKANTHKIRTVLALPKSAKNPYGGYDHDVINAAYDLATFGHLSPANRKALTALGVQIPAGW